MMLKKPTLQDFPLTQSEYEEVQKIKEFLENKLFFITAIIFYLLLATILVAIYGNFKPAIFIIIPPLIVTIFLPATFISVLNPLKNKQITFLITMRFFTGSDFWRGNCLGKRAIIYPNGKR